MNKESKKIKGKFAKGASGNPAGRPQGSRNRATLLMEVLFAEEAEQLTRKVIELAKEGDTHALRLCLDRLMPPGRDRLVTFDLPPINNLEDISLGTMAILKAVSEGKITPTECESLNRSLAEHANVMEKGDHERRLQKLEQAVAPEAANVGSLEGAIVKRPGSFHGRVCRPVFSPVAGPRLHPTVAVTPVGKEWCRPPGPQPNRSNALWSACSDPD